MKLGFNWPWKWFKWRDLIGWICASVSFFKLWKFRRDTLVRMANSQKILPGLKAVFLLSKYKLVSRLLSALNRCRNRANGTVFKGQIHETIFFLKAYPYKSGLAQCTCYTFSPPCHLKTVPKTASILFQLLFSVISRFSPGNMAD